MNSDLCNLAVSVSFNFCLATSSSSLRCGDPQPKRLFYCSPGTKENDKTLALHPEVTLLRYARGTGLRASDDGDENEGSEADPQQDQSEAPPVEFKKVCCCMRTECDRAEPHSSELCD